MCIRTQPGPVMYNPAVHTADPYSDAMPEVIQKGQVCGAEQGENKSNKENESLQEISR